MHNQNIGQFQYSMQNEIIFYPHKLIQKQTKCILNKIKNKKYGEIRRERSFGYEIGQDFSFELRRSIRKANTQCIKLQNVRVQKKRLSLPNKDELQQITKFNQLKQLNSKINSKEISLKVLYNDSQKSQQRKTYLNLLQKKITKTRRQFGDRIHEKELDNILLSQFKSIQCQNIQDQDDAKIKNQTTQNHQQSIIICTKPFVQSNLTQLINLPKQKPIFLPLLQAYIKEQQQLLQISMSISTKIIRNLIIQMMILALQRRKNGNLYDALDILLQTDLYENNNEEMKLLKSSWLMMISKIYDQIKQSLKSEKKVNRWKKRHSSIKLSSKSSRQKTIMIRSLASRRAFMYKCSIKYRQSNLINQTTYITELRNSYNIQEKDKNGKLINFIKLKVNQKYEVLFPQPKTYFQDELLNNYSIIVIKKDPETNLFPLVYPQMLQNCVPKKDYQQKICKINSYLIPSTRCFNYETSLYQNYEYIFLIIFSITLITMIIIVLHYELGEREFTYYWVIFFGHVMIFGLSLIILDFKNLKNHDYNNQIYQNMQRLFNEFAREYQNDDFQHIKFIINQNLDIIIINTPIFYEIQSENDKSNSSDQSQNHNNSKDIKKVSIKLSQDYATLFHKKDQINEDQYNSQASKSQKSQNQEKQSFEFDFQFDSLSKEEKMSKILTKNSILISQHQKFQDNIENKCSTLNLFEIKQILSDPQKQYYIKKVQSQQNEMNQRQ